MLLRFVVVTSCGFFSHLIGRETINIPEITLGVHRLMGFAVKFYGLFVQNLVTQLLLSTLKIHPAAYDLTKNYGIVAWIHSLCHKR